VAPVLFPAIVYSPTAGGTGGNFNFNLNLNLNFKLFKTSEEASPQIRLPDCGRFEPARLKEEVEG
jgi:hypothetical protein